ncbi:MAG TPA: VCBS repeat-containing protein, partial [Verrucomicrobiae bacterium]|nr:VCBS repeat-containing protein [Verrucomicrobiae bacterium]
MKVLCLVMAATLGGGMTHLQGQGFTWQEIPGARWAALPVPVNGKIGFTSLPPEQTKVSFTNTLDEWPAAANRVLLNGSGVAVGDYDNDGWPDIFFCSLNGRNTLERNLGGWRFEDVTAQAGLKRDSRFYRGAVFADVNGDGTLDLLVCVVGGGVECFLNNGQGKFSNGTAPARLISQLGSMTLALADTDGNGTLDLYVANNRSDDIRDRGQVNLQLVNGQVKIPSELKDRLLVVNGQVLEYGEPDQLYL